MKGNQNIQHTVINPKIVLQSGVNIKGKELNWQARERKNQSVIYLL